MRVENEKPNLCKFTTSVLLGYDLQMNKPSTVPKGPLNNFLETILTSEIKQYFSENKGI